MRILKNQKLPAEKSYEDYYVDFSEQSLFRLLNNIDSIEKTIISDINTLIECYLKCSGFFKNKEKEYYLNSDNEYIYSSISIIHRDCIIDFISPIKTNTKMKKLKKEMDSFGNIKSITIKFQDYNSINFDDFLGKISLIISNSYIALKQVFLDNFDELNRNVFSKMYGLLEGKLKSSGKSIYNGRIWFFISNSEFGVYFFDKNKINEIITYYEKNQHKLYSPFQLTIWLLSSKLPFDKSLAKQAFIHNKVLTLPWNKAKYLLDAPTIFLAEYFLYNSDDYSAHTLFKKRDYFLIVGIPAEIKADVIPIIEEIKETLYDFFDEGISVWSPYIKSLKKIIINYNYEVALEFLTSIAAKTIHEYSK